MEPPKSSTQTLEVPRSRSPLWSEGLTSLLLIVATVIAMLAGDACASSGPARTAARDHDLAPAITLPTPAGGATSFDVATLRRPTLVVVGASWCSLCKREGPRAAALAAEHRESLDLVAISVDLEPRGAERFAASIEGASRDLWDPEMALAESLGVSATPTLLLLGDDGRVRARARTLDARMRLRIADAVETPLPAGVRSVRRAPRVSAVADRVLVDEARPLRGAAGPIARVQALIPRARVEEARAILDEALRTMTRTHADRAALDPVELAEALHRAGLDEVMIDEETGHLVLLGPGVGVAPRHFSRGLALDAAARTLRGHGFEHFVAGIGDDVVAVGRDADGQPWSVGVQHPRHRAADVTVLAVSGGAISSRRRNQGPLSSATVLAPEALSARILATGVALMPAEDALALIEATSGAEAILVDAQGRIHVSRALRSHDPAELRPGPGEGWSHPDPRSVFSPRMGDVSQVQREIATQVIPPP